MTDPALPSSRTACLLEYLRAHCGPLLAAWLFPILAFLAATLFLGGNLGKNTDDYAINLRDPVTNAIPWPFNPLERYPFFWRPLHNTLCFTIGTLFPEANRSIHIAVALFHALSVLGLFLLLREMTRTRLAPALAALLFAVYPLHGEVAFWFCTTSTAIGTALFFAAALVTVRYARAEKATYHPLLLIFALFFIITCFYEQSAAPATALPFVVFAASPRSRGWAARLNRAFSATFAAGLACLTYVALLLSTAPSNARGNIGSFVKVDRLADRFHEFSIGVRNVMYADRASQITRGSLILGWETLHSPLGLVTAAALMAAAVLWLIWAVRRGGARPHFIATSAKPPDLGWLFSCGVATFIAAWFPVFVIDHQIIEMRNTYVPLIGLAMVVAALLDAILSLRFPKTPHAPAVARATAALAGVAAAAIGVVCLVGTQSFLHARWKQDQYEIAELKRLVPNPPPNTVFVPMRTNATPTRTGLIFFDRGRYGVLETPWSASDAIAFAYHRSDLGATSYNPWLPPPRIPLDKPGPDGARWTHGLSKSLLAIFPADPEGGVRIPWTNMVPLVTEPFARGNELRLLSRIDVESPDHRDLEIRPPIVLAAIDAAKRANTRLPATTYRFPTTSTTPDLIGIDFWEYGDGTPGQFISVHPWNIEHKATWLAANAGPRSTMSVQMPPLDRPENLLLRATIADYDLDPIRNPIVRTQELVVIMASAPAKELAVLRLDPLAIRAEKRWLPLIVTIPIRPPPAGDRIVVSLRLTNDPPIRMDPKDKSPIPIDARVAALPVWVTHGYEQSIITP